MGYRDESWNFEKTNPIEQTPLVELSKDIQDFYFQLGYNEVSHDCCLGHYEEYDWDDFDDVERSALESIGYDEKTWNNELRNKNDDDYDYSLWGYKNWDDLPSNVREVVRHYLCYNKELWDGKELSKWDLDHVVLPGSYINPYLLEQSLATDVDLNETLSVDEDSTTNQDSNNNQTKDTNNNQTKDTIEIVISTIIESNKSSDYLLSNSSFDNYTDTTDDGQIGALEIGKHDQVWNIPSFMMHITLESPEIDEEAVIDSTTSHLTRLYSQQASFERLTIEMYEKDHRTTSTVVATMRSNEDSDASINHLSHFVFGFSGIAWFSEISETFHLYEILDQAFENENYHDFFIALRRMTDINIINFNVQHSFILEDGSSLLKEENVFSASTKEADPATAIGFSIAGCFLFVIGIMVVLRVYPIIKNFDKNNATEDDFLKDGEASESSTEEVTKPQHALDMIETRTMFSISTIGFKAVD